MTGAPHHGGDASLTDSATIVRGQAAGQGTDGAYFHLQSSAGEPHRRRLELASAAGRPRRRRSLARFVQLTDFHILDPASPGRLEFAQRLAGSTDIDLGIMLPSYRPQEFLQLHAAEAMMRTVGCIGASPITGHAVQFLLKTGDLVDNAQLNELDRGLRLFRGGSTAAWSGGPDDVGAASARWPDHWYWQPGSREDGYKRRWGYPTDEGLLEAAVAPIELAGATVPWLSTHGNHDALMLGTSVPNQVYGVILEGSEKAILLPRAFSPERHLGLLIEYPELFISGPSTHVRPDARRRMIGTAGFLRAHLEIGGDPPGHGFTDENLRDPHCYYVDDRGADLRLIVLDTVNTSGHYQGSIGERQYAWLAERLEEVHSRFWDEAGRSVRTANTDRLVVICSHHGLASLINDRSDPELESDTPRVLAPQVEALLHRFPNVILWVNGHIHRNRVRPRPDPTGRTAGFWEVTTSSLIDWPCQTRLLEIVDNVDGTLSIVTTMIDHDAPADPRDAQGLLRLASLHRELAANDPYAGIASDRQGEPSDRNVELLLAAPFELG